MPRITPKNWREFQHYKDRNPPWIRLQKTLLDNYEFHCLPVASKALAPMLWLVSSDAIDGAIDFDENKIAFRLRMSVEDLRSALMARSNSPTRGHPKFPQAGRPDYDDSGLTAMRAAASFRR